MVDAIDPWHWPASDGARYGEVDELRDHIAEVPQLERARVGDHRLIPSDGESRRDYLVAGEDA